MGWDGMGWDGMGWDGMGWDGMGWAGSAAITAPSLDQASLRIFASCRFAYLQCGLELDSPGHPPNTLPLSEPSIERIVRCQCSNIAYTTPSFSHGMLA